MAQTKWGLMQLLLLLNTFWSMAEAAMDSCVLILFIILITIHYEFILSSSLSSFDCEYIWYQLQA